MLRPCVAMQTRMRVIRLVVLRLAGIAAFECGLITLAPAAENAGADRIDETVSLFFRPYQHDEAALSPDGRRVAMSEHLPGQPPGIVIVEVDDRSRRRYQVDSSPDFAVLAFRWISDTRLVFTTRAGAVGALDLKTNEVESLLGRKDLASFSPEPELGARRYTSVTTPDMSADTLSHSPNPVDQIHAVSLRDALAQARVMGDLFGEDARRRSPHILRPFILGAKPGSPHVLLIEVREDGDLFAYRTSAQTRLSIPGNTYLFDRNTPPPTSPLELDGRAPMIGEIATYDVTRRPPPLAVIELDANKGRWREIERDDEWRRVWLDQQGRVRLALEQRGRRFRYLYREVDAKTWTPLDAIVKSGTALGFTVDAGNLLEARAVPLGFDVGGKALLVASNVGRDTFSLRALDLTRGELNELDLGHDRFDLIEPTTLAATDAIRFDPYTHALAGIRFSGARREAIWFDAAMMQLQTQLSKQLARGSVCLREWTADRKRFLIEVSSSNDPGGFYVVDVAGGKLIHCGDRAPWLTAERRHFTHAFDFDASDGRRLAGFLTLPREPRLNPPPVLVYFHDGPWFADGPQFNRGAQALAELGFAVLQINHRGSGGLGRAHLGATAEGLDRTVLADVLSVLERTRNGGTKVNSRLVAAFGNGIGGYLAVRMVQLAPETFRCAVAINAPGDLDAWRTHPDTARTLLTDLRPHVFGTDRSRLEAQSALAAAATRSPVLVVHGENNAYVPMAFGRQLHHALKKGSPETRFLDLPGEGHGGWSPATTARLFAELGRFFNSTIYTYGVDVRKPTVVP